MAKKNQNKRNKTRYGRQRLTQQHNHPPRQPRLHTFPPQRQHPHQRTKFLFPVPIKIRLQATHLGELGEFALIRRIPDIEHFLHPARGGRHGTAMNEAVEGGAAAVGALAGVAGSTECHGGDGGMEEGVVDGGAAGAGFVEDCVGFGLGWS
jgi:hypothetical protein